MKLIRYVSMLVLIGSLVGCGHGYEGEFQVKAGSSNELLNAFAGMAGSQKIIIGSDYVESQGRREEFESIFVRGSGQEKLLVFKNKETEDTWEIVDKDTLIKGNGLMSIKLVRISTETPFNGLIETAKNIESDKSGGSNKATARKTTRDEDNKALSDELIDVNVVNSQTASSLSDVLDGITTAWFSFMERYRAFPGDYSEAIKNIPNVTSAGNGNGLIDSRGEKLGVWEHLSNSGYMNVTDKALRNPFGGVMTIYYNNDYDKHILVIGDGVPVGVLAELDQLTDDGMPRSGAIRQVISDGSLGVLLKSSPDCVKTIMGESTYNVTNTQAICNGVSMSF